MNLRLSLLLPLIMAGVAAAAESPTANAPVAEPPATLDPVEVTAEKRMENAFREVQIGLDRTRSDKAEDAERIVCLKKKPIGSNIPIIQCATNRYWERIRSESLTNGIGSVGGATGGGGGGSGRKDDKIFSMTLGDYNNLQKRFGKLPKELKDPQ